MSTDNELKAFATRLNQACDSKSIPPKGEGRQVILAKIFDVSQKGARKWLEGEAFPTWDRMIQIAKWGGVSIEWLATGRGSKLLKEALTDSDAINIAESNASYAAPINHQKPIPVVGMASLGDNGFWAELEYPVGHGDGHINYPSRDPNAYAVRCKGDSMRPRIRDGEFVIIEPGTPANPGDDVLVKATDGRVMVKTWLYTREGRAHFMSVNLSHPPISLALEDIDTIHLVAAIVQSAIWQPE